MAKELETKKETSLQNRIFPELERMAESFFEDRFPSLFGQWMNISKRGGLREEDDAYILSADLPGIPKEDIHVAIDGNMLSVRAEHNAESNTDKNNGYKREYRSYHQTFTLPSNIDLNAIDAHCENGRLEVSLPKTEGNERRKIEVKSGKEKMQPRVGADRNKAATRPEETAKH